MRRIVILPPHDRWVAWTDPPDPNEPDREKTFRLLEPLGYRHRRLDPFAWPWNPFAHRHPVLAGIDVLRALRVLLMHRRTDLVLCYFESSALVILLLRQLLRFRGKVVVYDVGVPGGWRLRNAILREVLPRADRLLPLGERQVDGLIRSGAVPESVHAILTSTYPDFFIDAGDRPDGYVLAVGDDISRDYPTLLAACAGLPCSVKLRSRLVTEDRTAYPTVEIVPETATTSAYRRLLADAALVVIPLHRSTHAGGISTLLEAMSSGKAVIVSESDGLGDYIEAGTNCRVVPPGDPAALHRAIQELLADPGERARLGANARRFIVERCSPESVAEEFVTMFGRLLHRGEPDAREVGRGVDVR